MYTPGYGMYLCTYFEFGDQSYSLILLGFRVFATVSARGLVTDLYGVLTVVLHVLVCLPGCEACVLVCATGCTAGVACVRCLGIELLLV